MRRLMIAIVLLGAAAAASHDASARSAYGPRCVPTKTGSGKTVLVCGSGQPGVYNPATCRKVYNSYTRRFEILC